MRVRIAKEKRIRGKVERKQARKFSKSYNQQACYFIQLYDTIAKAPVGVIPVRTKPTLQVVLRDCEREGLYPLILPQPVYVPKTFWEEYRHTNDKPTLIKEYELLRDFSIYRFETIVIDVDSPFDLVYPVWKEIKERLEINKGYQVYRTKSGRFRAYLYLVDGTKDFRRARELLAIIYAYFESRGLNADRTFVDRLNHPVFYEEFPLYDYRLIEERDGGHFFFKLYRKVKKLQKEERLYSFKGKNLTEWLWGISPPIKRERKETCKIIKAPAFLRKLREIELDAFELWKRAVITLFNRHDSYRYVRVIQPAIGWAKYLELPKDEVDAFLIELFDHEEKKRKDLEKAWKYAREIEFDLPEEIQWFGRSREDWEVILISKLRSQGEIARQELLKDFYNQKWLLDMIAQGLEKKGTIESFFVKSGGKGRPRKYYRLTEEVRVPLRKAVGSEEIVKVGFKLSKSFCNKENLIVRDSDDFSHIYNNYPVGIAIGGGWKREIGISEDYGISQIVKQSGEKEGSTSDFCSIGGCVQGFGLRAPLGSSTLREVRNSNRKPLDEGETGVFFSWSSACLPPSFNGDKLAFALFSGGCRMSKERRLTDEEKLKIESSFYSLLRDGRFVFDLEVLGGKRYKDVFLVGFSVPRRLLLTSAGSFSVANLARLEFKGREAVRFYKEVVPKLPEPTCLFAFKDKPLFVYPYGRELEKWFLVSCYPYFYVLHRSELLKRGRKKLRLHTYSVVYKISLSAFTLFAPYRKELVSLGEPIRGHEAGVWREELKETTKMVLEEFKKRKKSKLLITVALKDGREITGIMKRRTGVKGFFYTLSDPKDEKAKVFIFKHAVDDFWVEE